MRTPSAFLTLLYLVLTPLMATPHWYDDLLEKSDPQQRAPLQGDDFKIGGAFLYTPYQGKAFYLLGAEGPTARADVIGMVCPLTGTKDPEHETVADTIIAEMTEESAGAYGAPVTILDSQRVSLVTYTSQKRGKKAYAFIPVMPQFVESPANLLLRAENHTDPAFKEKSQYYWAEIPRNLNFSKDANTPVQWNTLTFNAHNQISGFEPTAFTLRASFVEDLMHPDIQENVKHIANRDDEIEVFTRKLEEKYQEELAKLSPEKRELLRQFEEKPEVKKTRAEIDVITARMTASGQYEDPKLEAKKNKLRIQSNAIDAACHSLYCCIMVIESYDADPTSSNYQKHKANLYALYELSSTMVDEISAVEMAIDNKKYREIGEHITTLEKLQNELLREAEQFFKANQ